MSNLKYFFFFGLAVTTISVMESCSPAGGNNTGHEYMPDMGHPVSYEANVYDDYEYNSWNSESVLDRKDLSNPRLPVNGTTPRGYVGYADGREGIYDGTASNSAIRTTMNGNVPYYFVDTEEDRKRAELEYCKTNPFPITKGGLARGKELYETYCGVSCHGKAGNGQGWLVSEENTQAKYPAQPANFIKDEFYAAGNGRFYHAIMHGKNVMQQHKDKLSYEERWQVIHYIRSLQAKSKDLKYDENENTFAPAIATCYSVIAKAKADKAAAAAAVEAAAKAAAQPVTPAATTPAPAHGEAGHSHNEAHGGGAHHK